MIKSFFCAFCLQWECCIGTDEYDEWLSNHENECQSNHKGSAGKMELDAIIDMFARSVDEYGVKYKYYVEDGDSKTYKVLLDKQPYGKDFQTIKKECVGHVQKRMGIRLRNAKKEKKGF